jgi:hypothetical protein
VPLNDVRRGDLEISHASFNKLVLELVEVRVRGTEGVGLPHQRLVVPIILPFLGHGLRLDAGACLIRRRRYCYLRWFSLGAMARATGLGSWVGVGWLAALGAISGAGFMLAAKACQQNQGLPALVHRTEHDHRGD